MWISSTHHTFIGWPPYLAKQTLLLISVLKWVLHYRYPKNKTGYPFLDHPVSVYDQIISLKYWQTETETASYCTLISTQKHDLRMELFLY